jgi:hypothetical protein
LVKSQHKKERKMNPKDSYSVYADYGDGDDRNHEYPIGSLTETQAWVQDILNTTTKQQVGQLTMTIRDIRGKAVSVHTVK